VGIPGWATIFVGILLIIIVQTLMLTVLFSFGILGGRQATAFIPRRDYMHFACPLRTIFPRGRVDNLDPLKPRVFAIHVNGKTTVL
jgi:hypothetical protein